MSFFSFSHEYRVSPRADEEVTPEETLVDSTSDYVDVEKPISDLVFRVITVIGFLFLGVVLVYSFWLSVIKHASFQALAERNRTVSLILSPPRGIIYDRLGEPLVENIPSFNVILVARDLPQDPTQRTELFTTLADILVMPREEFIKNIGQAVEKSAVTFAAVNVEKDKALSIRQLTGKGVYIVANAQRSYQDGQQFSTVLGYTGKVSQADLTASPYYTSSDVIGRQGIESQYESVLRGQHGTVAFLGDDQSHQIQEPVPGNNLVLAIDAEVQRHLWQSLDENLRGAGLINGAAVVQDVKSGAVLGMVSFPSYDNNIFTREVSAADYHRLFETRSRPLFNRVIGGLYNPGSTIKPFMALAELKEKVITPDTTIQDCVNITIPNPANPDQPYVFKNWRPDLGIFNLRRALAQSCNIFFFAAGGGFGDIVGLGIDKMASYLKDLFADAVTGIDLPGEAAGFVPTPDWKESTRGEPWYQGDTYNTSIGQGDLLVTPLWINSYVSAIANGGTLYKPRIALKTTDVNLNTLAEFKPEVLATFPFGPAALQEVRLGMREVVLTGTAQSLKDLPVQAAAKTGTAEVTKGRSINSLFTAYAPFDNPEISITVLVEGSESNQGYATRTAHAFLMWYFSRGPQ